MDNMHFEDVFRDTVAKSEAVLIQKSKEYASDTDKLHNFKKSAHLQDTTQLVALRGKMAKHTISIYDMLNSGVEYPLAVWDEKILDHINYLILLRAVVIEELESKDA